MKNQEQNKKGKSHTSSKVKGDQKAETGTKQQGGYSSAPEKQQTEQEQEDMHSERKLGDLDADREDAKPQEADRPAGKGKVSGALARGGSVGKPGKPQPPRQQAYK